jgi:hypothetical protein
MLDSAATKIEAELRLIQAETISTIAAIFPEQEGAWIKEKDLQRALLTDWS